LGVVLAWPRARPEKREKGTASRRAGLLAVDDLQRELAREGRAGEPILFEPGEAREQASGG
jgi:hypothetical protein